MVAWTCNTGKTGSTVCGWVTRPAKLRQANQFISWLASRSLNIHFTFLASWLVVQDDWELSYPPKMLLINIMLLLPILERCRRFCIDEALEHRHVLLMYLIRNIPSLRGPLLRKISQFLRNLLMLWHCFHIIVLTFQLFELPDPPLVFDNTYWSRAAVRWVDSVKVAARVNKTWRIFCVCLLFWWLSFIIRKHRVRLILGSLLIPVAIVVTLN